MALLHEGWLVKAAPFPFCSCDFDAYWHSAGGERVEAAQCDSGFGFLVVDGAAFEVRADDGLEAEHRGLGQRSKGTPLDPQSNHRPRLEAFAACASEQDAAGAPEPSDRGHDQRPRGSVAQIA